MNCKICTELLEVFRQAAIAHVQADALLLGAADANDSGQRHREAASAHHEYVEATEAFLNHLRVEHGR